MFLGMCDALALCMEPITGCKPWKQYRGTTASESTPVEGAGHRENDSQRKGFLFR